MSPQEKLDAALGILQAQITAICQATDRAGLVQLAMVLEREARMVRDRLQGGKRGRYPANEEG